LTPTARESPVDKCAGRGDRAGRDDPLDHLATREPQLLLRSPESADFKGRTWNVPSPPKRLNQSA